MRDRGNSGWASDRPEASERIPEVEQALALLLPPGRVPSVRFLDSQVRVTHGSSIAEEPQAFGPFGPLPSFPGDAEMIASAQRRPRRIAMLHLQPAPDALPYPEVEVVEPAVCPSGIAVVVSPPRDHRIEPVDGDGCQVDIRQHRRDDPALRRAAAAS